MSALYPLCSPPHPGQHGWQSLALIPSPPALVSVGSLVSEATDMLWTPPWELPVMPKLDESWDKVLPIPDWIWRHRRKSKFSCHLRRKQRCPKGTAQSPWGQWLPVPLETSQKKSLSVESCFWGSYTTARILVWIRPLCPAAVPCTHTENATGLWSSVLH